MITWTYGSDFIIIYLLIQGHTGMQSYDVLTVMSYHEYVIM